MGRPLEGMLVVWVEPTVTAPLCNCRLVEAGARVIKIERPEADFACGYDCAAHGQSSYFVWLNRGKESAVPEMKNPDDHDLHARLISRADVLVQNLMSGAMARAGFDLEALRRLHPQLVICSISGYGESGPYRDMKSYDVPHRRRLAVVTPQGAVRLPSALAIFENDRPPRRVPALGEHAAAVRAEFVQ